VVVDDDAIGRALVELLMHGKILVEPSGACALAAALGRKLPAGVRRAGVILSGGNLAPAQLAKLILQYAVTPA
jgi:threonine dehydratase